ncbi:MAG: response regulator transcription factor [Bacteroidota bacterium]
MATFGNTYQASGAPDIHVAIVEDDAEIRNTLALIIDGTPGFHCKYQFNDCETAIAQISEIYVHVWLMDINLPGISGIEGVRQLKPTYPDLDFIMLTINQDDDSIFDALRAGASGYLLKDTPPTELLRSIREVVKGGAPMSASIAMRVVQSFRQLNASPLSDRETEILKLLCEGQNYRSIAEALVVSPHTIRSHIKNIYRKLHVNSRAEAVKKAIDDRLI